mmetsp:Transcript_20143/g.56093  ORF Transcript_20143/g.56093 Transcript_20143/m.56093 type:complete len:97 (+) Transcript_20143:1944-2234(+)
MILAVRSCQNNAVLSTFSTRDIITSFHFTFWWIQHERTHIIALFYHRKNQYIHVPRHFRLLEPSRSDAIAAMAAAAPGDSVVIMPMGKLSPSFVPK